MSWWVTLLCIFGLLLALQAALDALLRLGGKTRRADHQRDTCLRAGFGGGGHGLGVHLSGPPPGIQPHGKAASPGGRRRRFHAGAMVLL